MPSANHNVELHLRYTNCDSSLSQLVYHSGFIRGHQ